MTDILKEFWSVIMGAVGALVWMLRLEARAALNAAAISELKRQRHEDLQAAREARDATNRRLDEIRGDLGEVRDDIKTLIRAMK
ncbi:MAG: hypothetical protein AB7U46_11245 [Paenirhodobacter sp.]|uniref:hypothetical protein n=1 Tax=Paenirhodobacter sp. TaxID=1965326 RepID=UPI003D0A5D31